jgi:tetratricopeptide (TPR) repeat protein
MICSNLGTLYKGTGQREKAEEEYQKALDIYRSLEKRDGELYQKDIERIEKHQKEMRKQESFWEKVKRILKRK